MGSASSRFASAAAAVLLACGAATAAASPGWTDPKPIFNPTALGVQTPQVAFGGDGSAMAVWGRTDIFTGAFESSVHSATGPGWGPIQSTKSSDDWTIYGFRLALDHAGNAVATWGGGHISYSWLELATRPAGGTWTDAELISGAQRPGYGSVAMDPDGKALVVWPANNDDDDPATQSVLWRVRPPGSPWTSSAPLSQVTATRPHFARYDVADVALDPAGRGVAAWAKTVDGVTKLEVSWRPAGGAWTTPHVVATEGPILNLKVREDGAGTATLAWSVGESGNAAVKASRTAWGSDDWEQPAVLTGNEGGADTDLDLAVDPGGKAIVVWTGYGYASAAVRPVGGGWQPRKRLSAQGAYGPVVALDPAGNATAAWTYPISATQYAVGASVRPQGGDWSNGKQLSAPDDFAGQPSVAMSPSGDGLVTWASFDSMNSTAAYAAYDVTPPRISGVQVPSAATAGTPVAVSMSAPSDLWSAVPGAGWDFGDGATAQGLAASHAYAAAGTYTVTARAQDALGNAASETRQVTVAPAPPSPGVTFEPTGPRGTVGTVAGVVVALPGAGAGSTPAPPAPGGVRRRTPVRMRIVLPGAIRAGQKAVIGVRLSRAVRGALVRVQLRTGVRYRTVAQGRVSGRRVPVALAFAAPGRYLLRVQIREAGAKLVSRVTPVVVTR